MCQAPAAPKLAPLCALRPPRNRGAPRRGTRAAASLTGETRDMRAQFRDYRRAVVWAAGVVALAAGIAVASARAPTDAWVRWLVELVRDLGGWGAVVYGVAFALA